MSAPATLAWFARHEFRLAWRDLSFLLQGGRRRQSIWVFTGLAAFVVALHVVALGVVPSAAGDARHPDKAFLLALTGSGFLAWTLLLSQAMETVTRFFYERADLDLILASPIAAWRLFAVRILAVAVTMGAMAGLLAGPFINVLAFIAGPRVLAAYAVVMALACLAAALAVCLTLLLFYLAGPKRTRLFAQIMAAVTGAGFVVGIQAVAISSQGSMSRLAMFQSPAWIAATPGLESPFWWPARAVLGDVPALAAVLAITLGFFAVTVAGAAPAFAANVLTVASLPADAAGRPPVQAFRFRQRSRVQVLRWKEWTLLRRDPWLMSQSLMQLLYLLPPALLLWHNFQPGNGRIVMLVPVLVMAAGQLAGGLAWLAISGEDAPDLVATAPVAAGAIQGAKMTSVLAVVALPVLPIAVAMAFVAPAMAAITVAGAALAAAGASAIQLIFKTRGRRANFRRRQTASRFATFAEAFLSIAVAAAAGLAAGGLWTFALVPAVFAVIVLLAARALAPHDRP